MTSAVEDHDDRMLTAADLAALRAVIREELARLAPRPPLPGLGAWTWSPATHAWVECGTSRDPPA